MIAPLRYWEVRLSAEPLYALVCDVGIDAAAKELGVTVKKVHDDLALLRYRYDTEKFSADQLFITDKLGRLVPLKFNKGQQIIAKAIEKQRLAGLPIRICLLKARQFGGSTEFEAEIFKDSTLRHHRRSMIIAHDLDSARHLRDMSDRYYENYQLSKPDKKKESDKWWKFKHTDGSVKADSHLLIDTADELSTGHSLTLHNLHLSEVQNWRNATELVKGLFPTVPDHPDTMIFMEGTGSGIGNYWYEFCQMAQDPSSGWEFVFVPWYEVEDYTVEYITKDQADEVMSKLDTLETDLVSKGCTPAQLLWRRNKIKNAFKGVVEEFMTQYPATPDEAFSTSGRPVFAVGAVKEGMRRAKEPMEVGNLVWDRTKARPSVKFVKDDRGLWDIWEHPVAVRREYLYCLGADVAEGKAVVPELGLRGGDYSVAKIMRRDVKAFVARCRVRIDPDQFAEELHKASIYWMHLPMMIENNPGGSGNVVIRDLKRLPGVILMRRQVLSKVSEDRKDEYGWNTNAESKREMIDELTEQIRDLSFSDPSKNFWSEASTYVRDEKGATNAQSRKFDDEVVSNAVTFQAHKFCPALYNVAPDGGPRVIEPGDDVPENWARRRRAASARNLTTRQAIMEENYLNF